MNKITKKFLVVVGNGFQFKSDEDLQMVKDTNSFLNKLSFGERVGLVEGLDDYAKGNPSKLW